MSNEEIWNEEPGGNRDLAMTVRELLRLRFAATLWLFPVFIAHYSLLITH